MTIYLHQTWLVPCPRCKAEAGSKCASMRSWEKKEVMSHAERWKSAADAQASRLAAGEHEAPTKEKS